MNPQNKFELLIFKVKLFLYALLGETYKLLIDLSLIKANRGVVNNSFNGQKVIISLTTYGRRTYHVYYTIISLLRQSYKPNMVILWLDEDNWNINNIPPKLTRLCAQGLTIKFCKDIKSYKKLIPTLEEFPDALVVTCDDDIYYRRNMLERLIVAYENDPTKIYAHRAHKISFDSSGNINKYNYWLEEISDCEGISVFPTSGGGTLYSRKLLYKDTCNEELFSTLSPMADDVWNYFMGLMQGTTNVVLPYKGYIYLPLDVFYQKFHKGSNLASYNESESMNDVQIQNIMNHYNLTSKDLKG